MLLYEKTTSKKLERSLLCGTNFLKLAKRAAVAVEGEEEED